MYLTKYFSAILNQGIYFCRRTAMSIEHSLENMVQRNNGHYSIFSLKEQNIVSSHQEAYHAWENKGHGRKSVRVRAKVLWSKGGTILCTIKKN